MGPLTLAVDTKTSSNPHLDATILKMQKSKPFASINAQEDKPFDFLRILFEGVIAGGTSGVVVETALYPIDTIKTRLQAGGSWWWENNVEGSLFWIGWKSSWCLTLVGNVSLYLLFSFLFFRASALFVGVYEPTKQKLLKMFPENLSAVAHLTAGAVGGIAASFIRVPTEVVKQRMQTGQFTSAPDAVRLIVSKEGFKGFYAGYGSFLLRDLPFDAIQFCIYEQLRIGYRVAAQRELNDPENAVIGAFAGNIEFRICELPSFSPDDTHLLIKFAYKLLTGMSWSGKLLVNSALTGAITTPLDVIKTRLMVQGSASANQYKGIIDCVSTVVREEGPTALLKGIGPRVLWIGIGGSIFFGVLERTKRLLAQRRPVSDQQPNPKQD
ncbi:hypothetical protein DKX38_007494 [Salix brachista]|uniref:Uncharacterized protein n=1 Tax=Salix brachista TaxID=2182728 RepID=A0A5N5MN43_9ROSI|nr:hypothetical protein DKX38_007494 [Salix brachista]